jgi:hypothetical protein
MGRAGLYFTLSIIAMVAVSEAAPIECIKRLPVNGPLYFEIKDEIHSPVYSWPRTLVSYPVDFSAGKIRPDQLGLREVDADPHDIAFQLSDVKAGPDGAIASGYINFFTDLAPGGARRFELRSTPNHALLDKQVIESRHDGVIEVDAGELKIRLPDGSDAKTGGPVPGPIVSIAGAKGWMGDSHVIGRAVEHVHTDVIDAGPLFRTYRITYEFVGGGKYVATVRSVLDYPFVEIREQMNGLNPRDGVAVEMKWTGFAPTKRFAGNGWECTPDGRGIDDPVMVGGSMEEPHWTPLDYVEDPAKEMVYHLAAYQGNAPRDATPVMSFWEEKVGGQELSDFIPDTLGWNDEQYMTWQPTTRLQVRFRYSENTLYWTWPLVSGIRRTDVALQDRETGSDAVEKTRQEYLAAAGIEDSSQLKDGARWGLTFYKAICLRNAQLLRSWYGSLDLDKVKDWQLTYPDDGKSPPVPFGSEARETPQGLETMVFKSALMRYPLGLDLVSANIDHRIVRPIVEQYMRMRTSLSARQRRRIDALLLLSSYINAGEDLAPIRTCAGGAPNLCSDGFSVPTEIGVLFPDHPMGPTWRDQFEKTVELEGCFHTRPDVPLLGSLGGRWTESLGTYNWAYFAATIPAQVAATMTDNRDRLANPWMAMRCRWMVDELSAPIYNPDPYARQSDKPPATSQPAGYSAGDPLTVDRGFERQYVPHGAHGTGTGMPISNMIPALATYMTQFDPLTAEHLLWAAHQTPRLVPFEGNSPWINWAASRAGENSGTNPHLRSSKYTGQGFILRAGVGTPEEVSVHLEQVDRGPNYRWGNNGEGSSGTIYYYGGGKVWSGHERENTGDHANDDTTGNTNFGVVSHGAYRTIGENILEKPLYDLGPAQFAEIVPRRDPGGYSWPAYQSRSVMLVGTDYIVVADEADEDRGGRFTWFTAKDLPFPKLVFLQPPGVRNDAVTLVQTNMSKGILRDAGAPSVVLVSHKLGEVEMEQMIARPHPVLAAEGLEQYRNSRDNHLPSGAYRVKTPTSHDVLFRAFAPIDYHANDESFEGKAGVIRHRADHRTELAIFKGSQISASGVGLWVVSTDEVGVAAEFSRADEIEGEFVTPRSSKLRVSLPDNIANGSNLFIDGEKQQVTRDDGGIILVALPIGRHHWQITAGMPTPLAVTIQRTENRSGGASVYFASVAGADRYLLETSLDGGSTWQSAAQGGASPLVVSNLKNGIKVHVRLTAANAQRRSAPGDEFPIYVSDQPPAPPDGLSLQLSNDQVIANWGEVLGVAEYRLYRRLRGNNNWALVFHGTGRQFVDHAAQGVTLPAFYPGVSDDFRAAPSNMPIYEYSVACSNENGEGPKSTFADTDPTGWLNWWPASQTRRFQRQTGYWMSPYVAADMTPPIDYPGEAPTVWLPR